jgi:hypothetical protein
MWKESSGRKVGRGVEVVERILDLWKILIPS